MNPPSQIVRGLVVLAKTKVHFEATLTLEKTFHPKSDKFIDIIMHKISRIIQMESASKTF